MNKIWLDDLFSAPHSETGHPNFVAIVIECDSEQAIGVMCQGLKNVPKLIVGKIEFRNFPETLIQLLGQIESAGAELPGDVLSQIDELLPDWEVIRAGAYEAFVPLRRGNEWAYLVWENSD